ncbi:hypothetical protein N2A41_12675 [Rhizobium sp. SRDI969]|nr:hypothetical protein N2A41_12675 [Rhizobium leguminosarum bv. viciae]
MTTLSRPISAISTVATGWIAGCPSHGGHMRGWRGWIARSEYG